MLQALEEVRRLRGLEEQEQLYKEQEQEQKQEQDLFRASYDGDIVSVRAALASGQSANSWGGDYTCLMAAVVMGHKEVFTELLQQEECDPSLENSNNKKTALHHASGWGRVGMVRQLASHPRQGSLNCKDCDGDTPIMDAVINGEAECVLALGRVAGVDLDTRDGEGRSLEEHAR